jgi:hypothetical protein
MVEVMVAIKAWAVLILLSMASCYKDEMTIAPGRQVGKLRLGDRVGDLGLNAESVVEEYRQSGIEYRIVDGLIDSIAVFKPGMRTANGLEVGQTVSAAKSTLGVEISRTDSTVTKGDKPVGQFVDYVLEYRGLRLMVHNDRVYAIVVVRN